ncbi:MAG: pilus assembly protein TadG-related protein, partial [Dermatophilaceae bacterium]
MTRTRPASPPLPRRPSSGPFTRAVAWWNRRRRTGADRGSVTLWVAVSVATILAVVALVADGGAKIRAAERADIVAGEAARAASYA